MDGTPFLRRCITAIFISAAALPAFAGLEECRLEAIDRVTETAAARCGQATELLSTGESFRGLSVIEFSANQVTLSDGEGTTVHWFVAEGDRPSRVRRIMDKPEKQSSESVSSGTLDEQIGVTRSAKEQ